jgi:hypothetical protein
MHVRPSNSFRLETDNVSNASAIQRRYNVIARFVTELNMHDKFGLVCKCAVFIVFTCAALSGKPPAHGQVVAIQSQITAVDAVQDDRIADSKAAISDLKTQVAALTVIVIQQGKDAASSDTKMNMMFGGAGLLQLIVIFNSFNSLRKDK